MFKASRLAIELHVIATRLGPDRPTRHVPAIPSPDDLLIWALHANGLYLNPLVAKGLKKVEETLARAAAMLTPDAAGKVRDGLRWLQASAVAPSGLRSLLEVAEGDDVDDVFLELERAREQLEEARAFARTAKESASDELAHARAEAERILAEARMEADRIRQDALGLSPLEARDDQPPANGTPPDTNGSGNGHQQVTSRKQTGNSGWKLLVAEIQGGSNLTTEEITERMGQRKGSSTGSVTASQLRRIAGTLTAAQIEVCKTMGEAKRLAYAEH